MVSSTAKNVDVYLQTLEPQRAAALIQLREIILRLTPNLTESMKYGMPTYQVGPGVLCAMASQKGYMSLYVEVEILDRYRDQFAHLNLGKSCIRFRKIETLPLDIVETILTETVTRLDGVVAGEET
jgi:uncharacterized protein YdhG (YjbR/CyaY superfamily)